MVLLRAELVETTKWEYVCLLIEVQYSVLKTCIRVSRMPGFIHKLLGTQLQVRINFWLARKRRMTGWLVGGWLPVGMTGWAGWLAAWLGYMDWLAWDWLVGWMDWSTGCVESSNYK